MIDGIKAILTDNLDQVRNNPLLDFVVPVSLKDGDIKTNKYPVANYRGLQFIDRVNNIELKGSIHKFSNQGEHNYNDFGLNEINETVYQLANILKIVTNKTKLTNLEVGVNLELDYDPNKFLNSLIIHRGKRFNYRERWNMFYKECIHQQFYIKIYNKGAQYSLVKNVLRVEVKYIKMERINGLGIRHISDLTDKTKLLKLRDELFRVFNEILIGDFSVSTEGLNFRDKLLFAKGHNPDFWIESKPLSENYILRDKDKLYKKDIRIYERKQVRFIQLLKRTGAIHRKENVRELLESKIDYLLDKSGSKEILKKRGEMTIKPLLIQPVKIEFLNKVTWGNDHCINEESNNSLNDKTWGNDSLLYRVKNSHKGNRPERKCVVTDLDISMQKEESEFLCTTGIKYYKRYNPDIWLQLSQRLSPKWQNCSEEIQLREIHHSIRNEYFNVIHNTKRSIKKVLAQPALFNQFKLIRQDKLEIAGMVG